MVVDSTRFKTASSDELFQQPFSVLPKQIPCIKLQLSAHNLQQMLTCIPSQLEQYEQSLQQKVTRFQSASSVRRQYQLVEKELMKLVNNQSEIGQPISFEKARILYDQVAYYLEWAMKELVYATKENLLSFTEKQWNQPKQLDGFLVECETWFDAIFHMTPTFKTANIQEDWIGISDDGMTYSYYVFAGYDVLYDFKTMFKTADVPGFVLNISKFLVRDTTRGKTKTALTEFAYRRVIKGMGIHPHPAHVFTYCSNVAYQLECSDYTLPLLTERKRYQIYRVYQKQKSDTYQLVQYDERKYGVTIDVTNDASAIPLDQVKAQFLACLYTEKEYGKLDFQHIPIEAMWLEDEAAVRELARQDEVYPAYTAMLVEQFLKRTEGGREYAK